MLISLENNGLKCVIDENNFLEEDLELIKQLSSRFVIKHFTKIQGHYHCQKHTNYLTFHDGDHYRIIVLPKYLGLKYLKLLETKFNKIINYSDSRTEITDYEELTNSFTLLDYQKNICDELEKKLYRRETHSVLYVAKPGTGKTIIALEMICRLGVKTIIIVPNLLLFNQWKVNILQFLNIEESEILIWNGTNSTGNLKFYNNNFKIIICTVQSSTKIDPSELQNNCSFIIYDEIHLYCSTHYSNVFWTAGCYYSLGLTATPNKLNGFEKIMFSHLNDITRAETLVELKNEEVFSGEVKIIRNATKYENILNEEGYLLYAQTLNQLVEDYNRNKIIVDEIIKLYDDQDANNSIYVFSDRRRHLEMLYEILHDIRPDIHILYGGSDEDEINDAVKNAKVILSTFHYSSTGVNIPKMDCLVWATCRKSFIDQIIGRITRKGGNSEKIRKIIDIVDTNSIFYNQFRFRKRFYLKEKYKLIYA